MRYGLRTLSACLFTAAPGLAQGPAALPPSCPAPATVGAVDPIAALDAAVDPAPYTPTAYAAVDYLLWYIKGQTTPDLIQTVPGQLAVDSVNNGTTIPAGGATRVFPPDGRLKFGSFSGVRGTVGYNFGRVGVELSGFGLERASTSGRAFNAGLPVAIAQSYVSAVSGRPISLFSSLAGSYVGGQTAAADSRLWGAEVNARVPWYQIVASSNTLLSGFRYLNLEESLTTSATSVFPGGFGLDIRDQFRTRNEAYVYQVGLSSRFGGTDRGVGLTSTLKGGLGGVHQEVDIAGSNTVTAPGQPANRQAGGLYAQPTNIGSYSRDRVVGTIEYDLNLTYNFTPNAQVFVGYSFLGISSVVRPGESIDTNVNDSRLRYLSGNAAPSPVNRPRFDFRGTDFWAQGLNLGAQFQY